MAIGLRTTSTGTTGGSGSATTVAANKPSNLALGDVMVAGVTTLYSSLASTAAPTGPTGWTAIGNIALGGRGNFSAWYRVADSTDVAASTFTWTFPGGQNGTAATGISAWTGVSLSNPIDASAAGSDSTSTTATAPAATTVTANTQVLRLFGDEASTGSLSFTTATGNTEEYEASSGAASFNSAVALDDVAQVAIGDTGAATSTVTGTQLDTTGYTVVLRPAGGSPVVKTASSRDNAASTSMTGDIPSGVVTGDLMLAWLFWRSSTATITATPSAGWNFVRGPDTAGANTATAVYWKIADGSDTPGSTYVWTISASLTNAVGIARISGHNAAIPIDTTNHFGDTGTATSHSFPQVTTSGGNRLLVWCSASGVGAATSTGSVASPLFEMWDIGGLNRWTYGAFSVQDSAGASSTPTLTTNESLRNSLTTIAIASSANYTQTATDTEATTDAYTSAIYRFGTRRAPDAILSLQGLTGTVSEIQDDPDSSDSNWLDYIP